MQAIILHKGGKRIGDILKGLRYENFKTKHKSWEKITSRSCEIGDSDLVVIHGNGQEEEARILETISIVRKNRLFITLVVFDVIYSEEIAKKVMDQGADGYFAKPFNFRDAGARLINIMCKKAAAIENKWLRAFDIWLDLEHRFVKRRHHYIHLRNKEFALLEFFMINRGKLLTRTSILEHVWDRNADFASNTVDVHINRLRKKIDDPFDSKLIHTVHCIGYIFDKKPGGK